MKKVINFLKKDAMLVVSILAALVSFLITPPSLNTVSAVDWKTIATLFMLLSVLDGFKHENLFNPLINLAGKIKTQIGLSFFLIFLVFFTSMFVTNDVSLIIFVPLTIILFRSGNKEQYILPVIVMENIAAVRGSLLTPFGSPQNLFLYSKSGLPAGKFVLMMLPLWLGSMVLLSLFIIFLYRKNTKENIIISSVSDKKWEKEGRGKRVLYLSLFAVILVTIVTRTTLWPYVTAFVAIMLLIFDRKVFLRVDYALLITFICFFIFSYSLTSNPTIYNFLSENITDHEYISSILISQVISNVPASIVLWPFTNSLKALIYGLDTAGLVSVIGSLASVINMRIYTKEYPGKSLKFIGVFEIISLAFFVPAFLLQLLLL